MKHFICFHLGLTCLCSLDELINCASLRSLNSVLKSQAIILLTVMILRTVTTSEMLVEILIINEK